MGKYLGEWKSYEDMVDGWAGAEDVNEFYGCDEIRDAIRALADAPQEKP